MGFHQEMGSETTIVVIVLKDLWGDLNYFIIFNFDNIICIVAPVDILVLLRDGNSLNVECYNFPFSVNEPPVEAYLGVSVGVRGLLIFLESGPLVWWLLVNQ